MPNTKLRDYISEKLSRGYAPDTIKNALLKWGYSLEDIEDGFRRDTGKEGGVTKPGNIFTRYLDLFKDTSNFEIKKALKHLSYSYVFFFIVQIMVALLISVIKGGKDDLFLIALTNISTSFLFLVLILFFSLVLAVTYLVSFDYLFKIDVNFSRVFSILILSTVPYILISSINGVPFYNILSFAGISLGGFSINPIYIGCTLLFSLGLSSDLGLTFKKSLFYTFIPFFVFLALFVMIFYSAIRFDFLWFSFQKF